MGHTNKRYSAFKYKLRINKRNPSVGSGNDRRSGKERRKTSLKKYFLEGGLERRSWKERRKYWYMTR
jgi:hypothetical protein